MRPVNFDNPVRTEHGHLISGLMLYHFAESNLVVFYGSSEHGAPTPDSFPIPDNPKTLREIANALNEQADYIERVSHFEDVRKTI